MSHTSSQPFDPMFAPHPRRHGQPVQTYARRPVHYRPAENIMDIRPAAPRSLDVPKPLIHAAPLVVTPVPRHEAGEAEQIPKLSLQQIVKKYTPNRQTAVLYGMATLLFLTGIGVSLSGLKANHQVAAQVKHVQKQAEQTASGDTSVPSTSKPSDATVRNYAVSPNVPRYVDIPKLKVHARTLSEGITKKGELQVPWNIYDTGWYNASSQPGQNGAMLVDGHSGIGKMAGVFNKLATLVAGDPVTVTRGDGQKFTYKVVTVQTVDVKNVDMGSMLVSADTSKPGLNLITCAGDVIPGTTELTKRVLVTTVLQ